MNEAVTLGRRNARENLKVQYQNATDFKKMAEAQFAAPSQVQGFYLRADLDGFSKDVREAFDHGDEAVLALVLRFERIMKYADAYASGSANMTVKLPWAGDCANLILLPSEGYQVAQGSLPVLASAQWHDQRQVTSLSEENNWAKLIGKNEWVVSCAGGNDEGSNGSLLIATIRTKYRSFLVGAGWGSKRSLDAQGVKGNRGGHTVLPKDDYAELDSTYRPDFEAIALAPAYYRSKKQLSMKALAKNAIAEKAPVITFHSKTTSVHLPTPKPYFK
jgi:hypothetical protein